MTDEAQRCIDRCNEGIKMADEVPERGEDFAASVAEKLQSISETIESRDYVTEAQDVAIENMIAGLEKWIHRG